MATSDWPAETPEYWSQVADLAKVEPPSDNYKFDWIAKKVPLYAKRPTAFDVLYLQEVSAHFDQLGLLTSNRLARAVKEPMRGHTPESYADTVFSPTRRLRDVSVWTIKSFHHWLTLKQMSGSNLNDRFDHIVEIGAGIGESARMAFDAFRFKGKYTIVDLPTIIPFSQKNLEGYPVNFTTDYTSIVPTKNTLVFSTWGLSEIELPLREQMLDHIDPAFMFVAFQGSIFGIDNREYFIKKYPTKYDKSIAVKQIPLHHIDGGNFYLWAKP